VSLDLRKRRTLARRFFGTVFAFARFANQTGPIRNVSLMRQSTNRNCKKNGKRTQNAKVMQWRTSVG